MSAGWHLAAREMFLNIESFTGKTQFALGSNEIAVLGTTSIMWRGVGGREGAG